MIMNRNQRVFVVLQDKGNDLKIYYCYLHKLSLYIYLYHNSW